MPRTYRTNDALPRLNVEALYLALDKRRRERRISWRTIQAETQLSTSSTLTRVARGHEVSADNLARLLWWLGETDLKPYLLTDVAAVPAGGEQ